MSTSMIKCKPLLAKVTSIAQGGEYTLPSNKNWNSLHVALCTNDYYLGPVLRIVSSGVGVLIYGHDGWVALAKFTADSSTRKITFSSLSTVVGTKASTWNISLYVFAEDV